MKDQSFFRVTGIFLTEFYSFYLVSFNVYLILELKRNEIEERGQDNWADGQENRDICLFI